MNKIMPIHLLLLSGLSLHFISCQSPPPDPLDFTQVQWENYTSSALGYSISIPGAYTLNEYADGYFTIFRHKGSPAVQVNFTNAAEGKKAACGLATKPLAKSNWAEEKVLNISTITIRWPILQAHYSLRHRLPWQISRPRSSHRPQSRRSIRTYSVFVRIYRRSIVMHVDMRLRAMPFLIYNYS